MTARRTPVVLLQVANLLGGVSNACVAILVPWLVLEQTGSAADAGIVGAAAAVPGIFVSPFVGALVDRLGRRRVSMVSDLLSAVSVALFPLLAQRGDADLGHHRGARRARGGVRPGRLHRAQGADPGCGQGVADVAGHSERPARGRLRRRVRGRTGGRSGGYRDRRSGRLVLDHDSRVRPGDRGSGRDPGPRRPRLHRAPRRGRSTRRSGARPCAGCQVLWDDRPLRVLTLAITVIILVYMPTEAVLLPTLFESRGRAGRLRADPDLARRGRA